MKNLETINLAQNVIDKTFELWWPELEKDVNQIVKEFYKDTSIIPENSGDKKIDEIFNLVQYISNGIARLGIPHDSLDFGKYNELTDLVFMGNEWNHPIRVRVFPFNANDSADLKEIIITNKKTLFKNLQPDEYEHRGVTIEILFWQEVAVYWAINFRFHKGVTYFSTYNVELSKEELSEVETNVIWRD